MNNKKKFEKYIEPYYKRIYYYILGKVKNKELAEDLVQNSMEKAWNNLEQLKNTDLSYTWCIRIADNTITEHFRRASALKRSIYDENSLDAIDFDIEDLQSDVMAEIINNENHNLAMSALLNVNEKNRSVLILRLIDDLSFKDISQSLGINSSTIRNRYARGLLQLQEEFKKIDGGKR